MNEKDTKKTERKGVKKTESKSRQLKSSWQRLLKQVLLSPFDTVSLVSDVLDLIKQDMIRPEADTKRLKALENELKAYRPDTELNTIVCSARFNAIKTDDFSVQLADTSGLSKTDAEILVQKLSDSDAEQLINGEIKEADFTLEDVDSTFALTLNQSKDFNIKGQPLLECYTTKDSWDAFENKASVGTTEHDIRSRISTIFQQESQLANSLTPVFAEPVGECFNELRHIIPTVEDLSDRTVAVSNLQVFNFETYRRFEFQKNWTVYEISDKVDYTMLEDFIYLSLDYPQVRDHFVQYLKNPSIAIGLLQSVIKPRLKEGRDTYREGNYRATLSELYVKVLDKYSSIPVEEGRHILVALVVQLLLHEVRDSYLIKIDAPYKVPVPYKAMVRHIPSVEDMEVVLLTQLVTQTLKLGDKLISASDKIGGGAFEKGKAIFLSDIDIEIRQRRRALVTVMTKLSVVHKRWQLVGAMALLKVYNLALPQHDVLRPILDDNQYLDELARDLSFMWPFLSSYDVTETALGLSISSEEATVALSTTYELWVGMRHWRMCPITSVTKKIFSDVFTGVNGERTGASLTSFIWSSVQPEQDVMVVASKHLTQVQNRKFAIYERHSYNRTEGLLQELDSSVTASNNDISNYLYYAASSNVPVQGFVTNLSDFHLVLYYAAVHNGVTHWDISESEDARGLLGKALGLPKTPRLVFKTEVEYEDNIKWLPYRTGFKVCYFKNLYDWCIIHKHEKLIKIEEGIYTLPVGIPKFGISDLLSSTLEQVNRGKASLKLCVSYKDGPQNYVVDVTTDFVGAEETARYAHVYRDHTHYQVGAYNIALGSHFASIWNKAMAEVLDLEEDDPKIQLEEAQALTEKYVRTFKSSPLFQNILNKAVNGLVLKISIEENLNFAGVYGARATEIRNRLGVVIARVLSARLGLYSPEALVKFESSIEAVLAHGLYDLWQ